MNSLRAAALAIEHARQQHARLGHDRAARLEHQREIVSLDLCAHRGGESARVGRAGLRRVGHAQAAAEVQMPNRQARRAQPLDQRQHLSDRFHQRARIENLRADVATDALQLQIPQRRGALVDAFHFGDVDAELVLAQAGGDVGVRGGVDVRVDAQGHARLHAAARRQRVEQRQFGFGFAVEAVDALVERVLDLVGGLADAGEDDAGRDRRRPSARGTTRRRRRCRNPRRPGPAAPARPGWSWP